MRKQSILALVLPVLVAACALPQSRPAVPTRTPTMAPTPVLRVDLQADASNLAVGGTVTVTGTFVGSFGNPMYYVEVSDQSPSESDWRVSLLPGDIVHETTGTSNVLELASIRVTVERLTAMFRTRAKGIAAVRIGINGEIVETDGTGQRFWNYVTKYSEGWTIIVA
jgi:hypothetical protein